MKLTNFYKVTLALIIILIWSCQSEYTKLVKKELASGIQNDSIFFNLKFGQTRNDFYRICWDLNKIGKATHGPSNDFVQTTLSPKDTTDNANKIQMLFYAKFNPEDIITGMDVKFSYVAWSLWNKEFNADKLLPKVQDTLMKWYPGNPFIKVKNILVKVDGNRQIELKQETDKDVSVIIENLSYKYNKLVK
jgi:hypothetical protein